METGASLEPQGKSGLESKLSYPAEPSAGVYVVDLGLHNSSLTRIFTREIASSKRELT